MVQDFIEVFYELLWKQNDKIVTPTRHNTSEKISTENKNSNIFIDS